MSKVNGSGPGPVKDGKKPPMQAGTDLKFAPSKRPKEIKTDRGTFGMKSNGNRG